MWIRALGLAAACLIPALSRAEPPKDDYGFVLKQCSNRESPSAADFCFARFRGFLDGIVATTLKEDSSLEGLPLLDVYTLASRKVGFCLPADVSSRQIAQVIVSYLEERPDERGKPVGLLMLGAAREAFPCEPVE
ncbi:Rap1a/Tai family immunity protein [Halovulum sp. GXIMD14793]